MVAQKVEEATSPVIVAQKKLEIQTPPPVVAPRKTVSATINIPPQTYQKDDSYAFDEESDIPMMPTLKPVPLKITPEFSKKTAVVA